MNFICSKCGKLTPTHTPQASCSCGGLFSLPNEFPKFEEKLIDKMNGVFFRYRVFMNIEGKAGAMSRWERAEPRSSHLTRMSWSRWIT